MIHYFEAETADAVWSEATRLLWNSRASGSQMSRAGETTELLHVILEIRNPRERWVTSRREALNVAFALAEIVWILGGRNDAGFLNYFNSRLPNFAGKDPIYHGAYGERLRSRFGLDQLTRVANVLRANPNSRQAVLQIWNPASDLPQDNGMEAAPDIPCNISSMLKVRANRLHWTQIMRSNDAYLGTPHNLIQFTTLQEILAGWIGVELGSYTHLSDSFHLYTRDTEQCPIAGNESGLPSNQDSLAIPIDLFLAQWPDIENIANTIASPHVSASLIERQLDKFQGSPSWRNILLILAAEGARKRKELSAANNFALTVDNPLLRELWMRWKQRLSYCL